MKGAFR